MPSRIAVVPGSFDPPTLGHLDVITRAAALFDRLDVLVVHNPRKTPLFSLEDRAALLRAAIAESGAGGDIRIGVWPSGLLVDYVRDVHASAIVKGIRSPGDVTYEAPMALVNRDLVGVETVFLMSDPAQSLVSSSLVRQVSSLGGDVTAYVPPVVARRMAAGA